MTTSSFPTSVHPSIQYYVYRLIDPRNGETFYVGKGQGNRVFAHAKAQASSFTLESDEDGNIEDEADLKIQRINAIRAAGLEVGHLVHRHGLDEATAKEVEAALIDAYPGLTNQVVGIDSDRGCKHVDEIIKQYGAEEFIVDEPLVIISCYKTIEEGRTPYDAARHAWHLNLEKVQGRLVLANNRGIIAGAFRPTARVGYRRPVRTSLPGDHHFQSGMAFMARPPKLRFGTSTLGRRFRQSTSPRERSATATLTLTLSAVQRPHGSAIIPSGTRTPRLSNWSGFASGMRRPASFGRPVTGLWQWRSACSPPTPWTVSRLYRLMTPTFRRSRGRVPHTG